MKKILVLIASTLFLGMMACGPRVDRQNERMDDQQYQRTDTIEDQRYQQDTIPQTENPERL